MVAHAEPARRRACNTPPRLPPKPTGPVPMADDSTASVIPLHQVPPPKRKARTPAKRARSDQPRKRKAKADAPTEAEAASSASLIPPEFLSTELVVVDAPAAPAP